jgi:hypothetical protein
MKKASGSDSPLRQGARRAYGPSQSRVDDGGGLQYVSWKINWVFRFSSPRRIYRRKGGIRRWARWPYHLVARARGWPLVPLHLCFGLHLVSRKIGTSAFVSSNSENISCVSFLKHKNNRKQGLSLWHLVNRLVSENT